MGHAHQHCKYKVIGSIHCTKLVESQATTLTLTFVLSTMDRTPERVLSTLKGW